MSNKNHNRSYVKASTMYNHSYSNNYNKKQDNYNPNNNNQNIEKKIIYVINQLLNMQKL